MKFGGGKRFKLRFGAGVQGVVLRVERSVALSDWFKSYTLRGHGKLMQKSLRG